MDIILSETNAACIVLCPWQSPVEKVACYSSIQLSQRSQKRTLGKAKRKASCCVVDVTVWSPKTSGKPGTSKTFSRCYASECVIKGSIGPGRIIGISNAIDDDVFVEYTWIVIAVSRTDGSNGIALLRFEENGIKLRKVFDCTDSPYDAVVLRGPNVLYSLSNDVEMEGEKGGVTIDLPAHECTSSIDVESFLCRTGTDLEAIVAKLLKRTGFPDLLKLYSVCFSGLCEEIRTLKVSAIESSRRGFICTDHGAFILAGRDGSLGYFDINTGEIVWKSPANKALEDLLWLTCYEETLVMTASRTVWSMPMNAKLDHTVSANSASSMFPDFCRSASQDEAHAHFFAPWRGSVLQISDKNGSYCFEKDLSKAQTQKNQTRNRATPFTPAVSRNLEKRLDSGVERVTDAAQRQEEKVELLNHLRSLLAEVVGQKSRASFPKKFHEGLENVMVLNRTDELQPRTDTELASIGKAGETSTRVFVDCDPSAFQMTPFLDLVESRTGVDKSGRFVIIQVCICVSKEGVSMNGSNFPPLSLQLNVHFDRCMAAIWDVEASSYMKPGDKAWLRACAPISAIVANSVSSMENLRVIVRVDSDDGRSQYLGTFYLSTVLSSVIHFEKEMFPEVDRGLLNFERTIRIVAQGSAVQFLQNILQNREGENIFDVTAQQKLARINFQASSNIELALALAKIRAAVGDGISLRSLSEAPIHSLHILDSGMRSLEKEIDTLRGIASQRGAIGYDVHQICELLRLQLEVDESFGRVEEIFVGS